MCIFLSLSVLYTHAMEGMQTNSNKGLSLRKGRGKGEAKVALHSDMVDLPVYRLRLSDAPAKLRVLYYYHTRMKFP